MVRRSRVAKSLDGMDPLALHFVKCELSFVSMSSYEVFSYMLGCCSSLNSGGQCGGLHKMHEVGLLPNFPPRSGSRNCVHDASYFNLSSLEEWKDGKIEKSGTMQLAVAVFDQGGGLGRGRHSASVGPASTLVSSNRFRGMSSGGSIRGCVFAPFQHTLDLPVCVLKRSCCCVRVGPEVRTMQAGIHSNQLPHQLPAPTTG